MMPRAELKKKLALLLAVSAGVWLLVMLVGGDSGALALLRAHGKHRALAAEVEALEEENRRLRAEIEALTEDPDEIERLAREELNMARPGEDVILLRDDDIRPRR